MIIDFPFHQRSVTRFIRWIIDRISSTWDMPNTIIGTCCPSYPLFPCHELSNETSTIHHFGPMFGPVSLRSCVKGEIYRTYLVLGILVTSFYYIKRENRKRKERPRTGGRGSFNEWHFKRTGLNLDLGMIQRSELKDPVAYPLHEVNLRVKQSHRYRKNVLEIDEKGMPDGPVTFYEYHTGGVDRKS